MNIIELRLLCFTVDPPRGTLGDIVVRNVTRSPLVASSEFLFSTVVDWEEPIYPHKYCLSVKFYRVRWGALPKKNNALEHFVATVFYSVDIN